jgi:hypothetical protein
MHVFFYFNSVFIFVQFILSVAFQDFSITVATSKGTFYAYCPSGKKVLSCSIKGASSIPERWRAAYPSDDGTKCTCYDDFGAK